MKSIVIYDSNFGNTKQIAEIIAKGLEAKAISVDNVTDSDLTNLNLLVLGSPIIGWMPTEKTQKFLKGLAPNQLKSVNITTFDTRVKLFIHGDAMLKMAKSLIAVGGELLTSSMPFYVKGKEGVLLPGEVEKAKAWALQIRSLMN